jgi:hypothetical protein
MRVKSIAGKSLFQLFYNGRENSQQNKIMEQQIEFGSPNSPEGDIMA